MQPTVAEKVRATAERFAGMGASLEEISIPEHTLVAAVWNPIALEGLLVQMMHGNAWASTGRASMMSASWTRMRNGAARPKLYPRR